MKLVAYYKKLHNCGFPGCSIRSFRSLIYTILRRSDCSNSKLRSCPNLSIFNLLESRWGGFMDFEGFRMTVSFAEDIFALNLHDDNTNLEEYKWVGTIPINDDLHNSLIKLLMIAVSQRVIYSKDELYLSE